MVSLSVGTKNSFAPNTLDLVFSKNEVLKTSRDTILPSPEYRYPRPLRLTVRQPLYFTVEISVTARRRQLQDGKSLRRFIRTLYNGYL